MNKQIKKSKKNALALIREHHFPELIGHMVAHKMKQQTGECNKRIKRISVKIQEVSESIDIIARQVARRAKKEE